MGYDDPFNFTWDTIKTLFDRMGKLTHRSFLLRPGLYVRPRFQMESES